VTRLSPAASGSSAAGRRWRSTTSGDSASTSSFSRCRNGCRRRAAQLGQPPVDDADQLLAPRVLCRQPHTGRPGSTLQHRHVCPRSPAHTRRLTAHGADNHHLAFGPSVLRMICGISLAPRQHCGSRHRRPQDAIEAIGGAARSGSRGPPSPS
jgi:hypothetical protein